MVSDGVIALKELAESELNAVHAMSGDVDTRDFIVPYSLQRHHAEFAKPDVVYLSILAAGAGTQSGPMLGYFILVLDPDDASVECRRIVVGRKGRGTGKRAMRLLDRYCREALGRTRIWLDVYGFNTRGQRVYESCGYRRTKEGAQDGKTLFFYEKRL